MGDDSLSERLRQRIARYRCLLGRVGRREVPTETVVVAELVAEVIEAIAPPANFAIAIAAALPTLQTKCGSLAQVFSHLIGAHHHFSLYLVGIAISQRIESRVDYDLL